MTNTSQARGGGGALSALVSALLSLFVRRPPAPAATTPQASPDSSVPATAAALDATEIDILARTLWGEARGEGRSGIEAVAAVIVNRRDLARAYLAKRPDRSRHPLFGSGTLASACLANPESPYRQFSCWNVNDPNRAKLERVTADDAAFRQCLDIARLAVEKALADRTRGATHYYDVRINPPKWTVGATPTVEIGHHRFFKEVP